MEEGRKRVERIVGPEYADIRIDDWVFSEDPEIAARQRRVIDWLKDRTGYASGMFPMLSNLRGNVLLVGPPGTGKDWMASWLVKLAVAHGRSVQWFSGASLFAAFRAEMQSGGSEAELFAELMNLDYLYISDPVAPGTVLSEYQASVLYRLADQRRRLGRPCWLTVNAKTEAECQAILTAQVWDRFKAGASVVQCFWESFRKPAEVVGGKAKS